jgi:hypothetical protein
MNGKPGRVLKIRLRSAPGYCGIHEQVGNPLFAGGAEKVSVLPSHFFL